MFEIFYEYDNNQRSATSARPSTGELATGGNLDGFIDRGTLAPTDLFLVKENGEYLLTGSNWTGYANYPDAITPAGARLRVFATNVDTVEYQLITADQQFYFARVAAGVVQVEWTQTFTGDTSVYDNEEGRFQYHLRVQEGRITAIEQGGRIYDSCKYQGILGSSENLDLVFQSGGNAINSGIHPYEITDFQNFEAAPDWATGPGSLEVLTTGGQVSQVITTQNGKKGYRTKTANGWSNWEQLQGNSPEFKREWFWATGPAPLVRYKIATMPKTTGGTYDHLVVRAVPDDDWRAVSKSIYEIYAANRDGFTANYLINYGTRRLNALIEAYQNAVGDIDIYAGFAANVYSTLSVQVESSAQVVLYPEPAAATIAATDTLLFSTVSSPAFDLATRQWANEQFTLKSHHHDDRYFTQAQLVQSGLGGAVNWGNVFGNPPFTQDNRLEIIKQGWIFNEKSIFRNGMEAKTIQTQNPDGNGTSGPWRLGSIKLGSLTPTHYVEVAIDNQIVKLPCELGGALPTCAIAPMLSEVVALSKTSLRFRVSSIESLTGLSWNIRKSGSYLASGTIAQADLALTMSINFSELPNDTYELIVAATNCSHPAQVVSFAVNFSTGIQACPVAVAITGVGSVTANSLTFSVNSTQGVNAFSWYIRPRGASNVLRSGSVNNPSQSSAIDFEPIEIGNYDLQISAQNCTHPAAIYGFEYGKKLTVENIRTRNIEVNGFAKPLLEFDLKLNGQPLAFSTNVQHELPVGTDLWYSSSNQNSSKWCIPNVTNGQGSSYSFGQSVEFVIRLADEPLVRTVVAFFNIAEQNVEKQLRQVWTFGMPGDGNLAGSEKLQRAIDCKIDTIALQEMDWARFEPTSGNFNFDEVDYILTILKRSETRILFHLSPSFALPSSIASFQCQRRINPNLPLGTEGNFTTVSVSASGSSFLPEADYERDRRGRITGYNFNLGKKSHFSMASTNATGRCLNAMARFVHACKTHPYGYLVLGFCILGGDYNETGFGTLEADYGNRDPNNPNNSNTVEREDIGYADVTITDYRAKMTAKFGSIGNLNAAWGTSFSSFGSITKDSIPKPTLYGPYNEPKIAAYNENAATRDFFKYKVDLHANFYRRFVALVKNPSVQINGLTGPTGFSTFCYITENFSALQGFWGTLAMKSMYEMFDNAFFSRTSGNSSNHANSFLGDCSLTFANALGTFGPNVGFGQEKDNDPVDKFFGQSRIAKLCFEAGGNWSVVALGDSPSSWDHNVEGVNLDGSIETRSFRDDLRWVAENLCNRPRQNPTIAGVLDYSEDEAITNPSDPGGKKSEWLNRSGVNTNGAGIPQSRWLLRCNKS